MKLKTLVLGTLFALMSACVAQAEIAVPATNSIVVAPAPSVLTEQTGLPGYLPAEMNLVKAGPAAFLIDVKGNSKFSSALSWIEVAPGLNVDVKYHVQKIADSEKDQDKATITMETYSGVTVYTLHRTFMNQGKAAYGISSYAMYNNRVYSFHFGEDGNNMELEKFKKEILTAAFMK